jgi:hypothetical protein
VTASTFLWAVVVVLATFVAFFIKHVVEAPAEIDNLLRIHLARRQNELLAERERNAKPH